MKPHGLKSLKYLLLVNSLQKKCWPTPCSERIKNFSIVWYHRTVLTAGCKLNFSQQDLDYFSWSRDVVLHTRKKKERKEKGEGEVRDEGREDRRASCWSKLPKEQPLRWRFSCGKLTGVGSQQYQSGSERTKSEDRQKVNYNAQPPGDAHWAGIGAVMMPAR